MIQTKTDDVVRRAIERLSQSSIRELRAIRVDECDHTLELTGNVRSFYHKQLAQETVRTVADGRQLVNRVTVSD